MRPTSTTIALALSLLLAFGGIALAGKPKGSGSGGSGGSGSGSGGGGGSGDPDCPIKSACPSSNGGINVGVFLDNTHNDRPGTGTVVSNVAANSNWFKFTYGSTQPYSLETDPSGNGRILYWGSSPGYDPAYCNLNGAIGPVPRMDWFDRNSNALFDFDRYRAAANATGNTMTIAQFKAWIPTRTWKYGIVRVKIDYPTDFPDGKKLMLCEDGEILIKGTLLFDVTGGNVGGIGQSKVFNRVPLNVNPINGPISNSINLTGQDMVAMRNGQVSNVGGMAPGYPFPIEYSSAWVEVSTMPTKDPRQVPAANMIDDNGVQHTPFGAYEDFPAVMYTGGTYDIHNQMNISGLMYTPNKVEIHKDELRPWQCAAGINATGKYCIGAVVGGYSMVYDDEGYGAIYVYDPEPLDALVTNLPEFLTRGEWHMVQDGQAIW